MPTTVDGVESVRRWQMSQAGEEIRPSSCRLPSVLSGGIRVCPDLRGGLSRYASPSHDLTAQDPQSSVDPVCCRRVARVQHLSDGLLVQAQQLGEFVARPPALSERDHQRRLGSHAGRHRKVVLSCTRCAWCRNGVTVGDTAGDCFLQCVARLRECVGFIGTGRSIGGRTDPMQKNRCNR